MNEYNKRPYIIELYGVLPTVVALLIFGAFRNQDLSDTIRWIFIGVLALAIIALLKSTALFFVGVATVLEKAYFHHPLTGYVCALLVGIGLVASTEKDRQARIFRAVLFVLGLGLAPILRIPVKWGTDSGASGAASERSDAGYGHDLKVPHMSQDFLYF